MENPMIETRPNIHVHAQVSADGESVTLTLPDEFVKERLGLRCTGERHKFLIDPINDAWSTVYIPTGRISSTGVKVAQLTIPVADLQLRGTLRPGASSGWWAKDTGEELWVGTLFCDLSTVPTARPTDRTTVTAAASPHMMLVSTPDQKYADILPMKPGDLQVVDEEPIELTPTEAISFLNEWAKETGASFEIEDGKLYACVKQRIGG